MMPNTRSGRFSDSSCQVDVSVSHRSQISAMLSAVGLNDRTLYITKHMPIFQARNDPAFWSSRVSNESYSANVLMNAVEEIARRSCALLCGGSHEPTLASNALYEAFIRSQTPLVIEEGGTRLLMNVADSYVKAAKASVEKRVLRACLSSYPRGELQELSHSLPDFKISKDGFAAARRDLESLKEGRQITKALRSLSRFDPTAVEKAVEFILSPTNVSFLSWGTKKAHLDGNRVSLPAITRRRSRIAMFDDYADMTSSSANEHALSRATFFRIASAITASDTKKRSAVDYVVGFLVNDSFDLMKQIANAVHFPMEEVVADMEAAQSYLKYGFDSCLKEAPSAACLLHDIAYGLNATGDCQPQQLCDDCKCVFFFYSRFKERLIAMDVDLSAVCVVDACSEKAQLYFGHRLRVINQQLAIKRLLDEMRVSCIENRAADEALVTLDFKMKLEPMYYREKTVDHYDKRGISWHGALVRFFEYVEGDTSNQPPKACDQSMYFDHISKDDARQDRDSVVSLVEAVLIRLRKDFPFIKKIAVLTDNASCYQNALLPLVLPYLAIIHGVSATKIIHTETQDGKSALDAHFAKAMQVLVSWVREGNNCITPTQAVIGLKSRGGLPNSVVELIEHDRSSLKFLGQQVLPMEKQLRRVVPRANEIRIEFAEERGRANCAVSGGYEECPDFILTLFEYSGIGPGVVVSCSPRRNACFFDSVAEEEQDEIPDTGEELVPVEEPEVEELIVVNENEDEVRRRTGVGAESELEESDMEVCSTDTIDVALVVGPATGVRITTQGQLRRRTRRWRHPPRMENAATIDAESRDAVSLAIRLTLELRMAGALYVRDPSEGNMRVSRAELEQYAVSHHFLPGWAVRPKRGHRYGQRYVKCFRGHIEELFSRGQADAAMKMGPGRMLEEVKARHPDRFDLPSENEIRQEIARLSKLKGIKAPSNVKPPVNSGRAREETAFIEGLVAEDLGVKPRVALVSFRVAYAASTLSDNQVKSKVSYAKTKMKHST